MDLRSYKLNILDNDRSDLEDIEEEK